MEKVRQHCQALKIAMDHYAPQFFGGENSTQMQVVLPRGVRVIALPANPQTARGFTGDVFLDEFALHADDREIWAAMLPTILRGDGELDVASTPRGKNNVFYQLRDNDRFETSIVTIHDANAQGLGADVDALREAMGDDLLFRQEFLCEFIDEATAFLTYDQIDACADSSLTPHDTVEALAKEQRDLFVGIDIGRVHDLTVLWVLSLDGEIFRTIGLFELSAAPFRVQFSLICDILSCRRVRRCCIDAGGLGMQLAEQAVERFGGHRVEAVTFTTALKSQMASALRIAVEAGRIRIPDDKRIRNDWHSIERTVTESGHFRLSASRREGSHADRFWAAALALHAVDLGDGRIESMEGEPLHFARSGTW